ncbi:Alpha/beta hydrolase family protein [compost metagenome]
MSILPRRDWSVYIIDQPRRGRAGYTMSKIDTKNAVPTILLESAVWDAFRNGIWKRPANPYFFQTTQFPNSPYAVDQFFRQQAPDTGEEPRTDEHRAFMGKTMAKLLEQTGPSILITHSNSGQYGWATVMEAPEKIKAIVAYEPGRVVFPDDEIPENIPTAVEFINEALAPQLVSMEEFKKLTKMPILIIYGDNISTELTDVFNSEVWRVASKRAKQFVDAVNRNGGDAKLILLNEIGIYGNTHAPFADLNNMEIADLLEKFLKEKGLDGKKSPHKGPVLKDLKEYTIPISK